MRILASQQPELLQKVKEYSQKLENMVIEKQAKLDELGYEEYLYQILCGKIMHIIILIFTMKLLINMHVFYILIQQQNWQRRKENQVI